MDINPSDTLQYRSAREHDDERHICPLHLRLFGAASRFGQTQAISLSPFMGIGPRALSRLSWVAKFVGGVEEVLFRPSREEP